jgi:Ferredoxin subunits of nitrite reductase and ring-hydroxylating dioxygenases
MGYVRAARIAELPENAKIKIELQGKTFFIAHVNGNFFALANKCPHLGGSLCDGLLSETTIKCPVHGAEFELATGKAVGKAKLLFLKMNVNDVEAYKTEVRGEEVFIDLP